MDKKRVESYFFNRNNVQCSQPSVIRQSQSKVDGLIKNNFGQNWQGLIDELVDVAKVHGNIVRIDLGHSLNPSYLQFVIQFENSGSAENCKHLMMAINNLTKNDQFVNLSCSSSQ